MHSQTAELFKIHLFKVIFFFLDSESIAVRTPQSVELRLAGVLVEAFAESCRPSVNEGFHVGLFCLGFPPPFSTLLYLALVIFLITQIVQQGILKYLKYATRI